MSNCYVREYSHLGRDELGGTSPVPCEPALASAHFSTSNIPIPLTALQAETRFLLLRPEDGDHHIDTGPPGSSPSANASDTLLPRDKTEIFAVEPGTVVSLLGVVGG